ncbi:MAG: DUF2865 domain-containing protein [Xanthobacteraceae bacterium]
MSTYIQNRRATRVPTDGVTLFRRCVVATSAALAVLMLGATAASAQNLFDSLFGRRPSAPASATAYSDPFSNWNPFGGRPAEPPRTEIAPTTAFCVRLCDGRFFPIERPGGASPAQTCSAFCPAAQTKIYNGSTIEAAVGNDGKPYRELGTAFLYREKIVPACSCNGKDAFGLVNMQVAEDPTLRPGDIVATAQGLMAYNGKTGRKEAANFTPVQSYSGLSSEVRRKLTETKVAPADRVATSPATAKPVEPSPAARSSKNKRVQIDR